MDFYMEIFEARVLGENKEAINVGLNYAVTSVTQTVKPHI
jgi:hypothetical protein